MGPNTELFGTPNLTGRASDFTPFMIVTRAAFNSHSSKIGQDRIGLFIHHQIRRQN